MVRWLARAFFLRFLPRRLLPIVTIAEIALLVRGVRNKRRMPVNEPLDSRTSPPPPLPPQARNP